MSNPLWLPKGSIRGLIALGITLAFIFDGVPMEVVTLVLGFYFGTRSSQVVVVDPGINLKESQNE